MHGSKEHIGPFGTMPTRAGTSLKPAHYHEILETRPAAGWFEVHAENYMGAGGPPHHHLERIRARYPLSVHGVGLSIGGSGPLDADHLARLRDVVHRYEPELVSEHLAWSSHGGTYFPDLLPIPYTPASLASVCDHVDRVQEILGRPILIENPSTYVVFETSTLREVDFLSDLAARTGCGLLLDVNNVLVSATNHRFDAEDYLRGFPMDKVGEIHLAGHAEDQDETGAPLLIDSHDRAVSKRVWDLYRDVVAIAGPRPTLIEWDADLPALDRLLREAALADAILESLPTGAMIAEAGDAADARLG
jgi:uncharacterized protein (UPF0276 family)